ncbi:hypothetical protein AHiyo1_12190 [Arthrobacter sp. Hiyo1]|nr:hypothetical protein AHiyo1_12190 [Arthrobacter sp. Hiyo1]
MTAAAIPVPTTITTTLRKSRAAPKRNSASAAVLTSCPKETGSPRRCAAFSPKGKFRQPRFAE